MKIRSLQEFVNWLLVLDPKGSICWPCMLPSHTIYLHEEVDGNEARAIKLIQELSTEKEEPLETFLRLLNQFILVDLKINPKKFVKNSPICLNEQSLKFSWKAFTHWIIGQLELVTEEETILPDNFRASVDGYKNLRTLK